MMFPFQKKKTLKERLIYNIQHIPDKLIHIKRKLPAPGFIKYYMQHKSERFFRHSRYLAEDIWFQIRRYSRYMDLFLFASIIILGVAMYISATGESFLNSLIALLLLVLVVVIYMQLRFQKRMLNQYVPTIDILRITRCQLYSKRLRVRNFFGAKEKIDQIKMVKKVRIRYEIINDSFAPVSIKTASLGIKMKRGSRVTLPPSMSVIDIEPKRTGTNDITFVLKKEIKFDSIDWIELHVRGNCSKDVRIKPHLYVNLMLWGKVPKPVFEPYDRFIKRSEIRNKT